MAWACMAANGSSTLAFIDDITADGSHRMNAEMCAEYQSKGSKLFG